MGTAFMRYIIFFILWMKEYEIGSKFNFEYSTEHYF